MSVNRFSVLNFLRCKHCVNISRSKDKKLKISNSNEYKTNKKKIGYAWN